MLVPGSTALARGKRLALKLNFCTRSRHCRRFRSLSQDDWRELHDALVTHYYSESGFLDSPEGQQDLEDHLTGRITRDRNYIVPWLDAAKRLQGSRILEIGCGTGTSTVALAEQGASVIGIDINEPSLKVAQERCRLYEVDNVELILMNATELEQNFSLSAFDFVIYFASLEHMILEERLASLTQGWRLLSPGGWLCVVDTPNRLWPYDSHTSYLPFFHWLPDDLAIRYTQFSPRPSLKEAFCEAGEGSMSQFLRRGRGVSYHEFDLSIGDARELRVATCKDDFVKWRNPMYFLKDLFLGQTAYRRCLSRLAPGLHPGFFRETLNIIIQKM